MDFAEWKKAVDRVLKQRSAGFSLSLFDHDPIWKLFEDGLSPVLAAQKLIDESFVIAPTKPARPTPIPQAPQVLNDAKYLLNTGAKMHCPQCGSTNIQPAPKSGTGLMFWGSIPWVAAGILADSMLKSAQKQPYLCQYCNTAFYEEQAADRYASERN